MIEKLAFILASEGKLVFLRCVLGDEVGCGAL